VSKSGSLRIVVTHDFCCSYPPSPTSYGSLPGGEGLTKTVGTLREQGPTVRADAGDFAAPGALATLSDGEAGFAAAADLGEAERPGGERGRQARAQETRTPIGHPGRETAGIRLRLVRAGPTNTRGIQSGGAGGRRIA